MKTLDALAAEMMADPEFRAAYDALAPEYEQAAAEIAARMAQRAARRQNRPPQVAPVRQTPAAAPAR